MNDQNPPIEAIRWPAPVLRVTLRWDGKSWRIDRQQRVGSMTLPAPDALPEGEKSRGFWVEVVDRQGRVRHREVMADPLAGMEQFDEGGVVSRLLHSPHNVLIEVLVPDVPDIAELHLVSNPPARTAEHDVSQPPIRTKLSLESHAQNHEAHDDQRSRP